MNIEIVHHEMPARHLRIDLYRADNVGGKVCFGARGAAGRRLYLPGDDIEIHDESQRAMPDVFMFAAGDLSQLHRQARILALQSLDARHFIGGKRPFAAFGPLARLRISLADVLRSRLPQWIGRRGQPITYPVRFKGGGF